MTVITSFKGEYAFLSNFFPASVPMGGKTYPTVEHAFQAAKTNSEEWKERICLIPATQAGKAKRLGRKVPLIENWNEMRVGVMTSLVRRKFWMNEDLQNLLLATGDRELIEGNTWKDTFWGICNGVGENHLGKILMRVRKELVI